MHFSQQLMQREPQFIYLFEDNWPGIYCLSYLRLSLFMYMIFVCLEEEVILSVYSQYFRQLQQVDVRCHFKSYNQELQHSYGNSKQRYSLVSKNVTWSEQKNKRHSLIRKMLRAHKTDFWGWSEFQRWEIKGLLDPPLSPFHQEGCVDFTWTENDFKVNWKCSNKSGGEEDCRVCKN